MGLICLILMVFALALTIGEEDETMAIINTNWEWCAINRLLYVDTFDWIKLWITLCG